jgi:hypothetical protein
MMQEASPHTQALLSTPQDGITSGTLPSFDFCSCFMSYKYFA